MKAHIEALGTLPQLSMRPLKTIPAKGEIAETYEAPEEIH